LLIKTALSRRWWLTPVILAIQEAEIRRIWFEASMSKQFDRPVLKIPNTKKGLEEWLKW
jgi:hypothetical protein